MLQICHCVQLNALFCCLWRNDESSCHKHFVVFSRNLHRRLPPPMCHNLRDGGRRPPATLLTTPCLRALKPDIGSESRFLPTPPAFDTAVRGSPSEYWYAVWRRKLAWWVYPTMKKIWRYVYSFWHDPRTCGRTDTQTDTAWRHRPRLCIASRGKNYCYIMSCSVFTLINLIDHFQF